MNLLSGFTPGVGSVRSAVKFSCCSGSDEAAAKHHLNVPDLFYNPTFLPASRFVFMAICFSSHCIYDILNRLFTESFVRHEIGNSMGNRDELVEYRGVCYFHNETIVILGDSVG